MQASMTTAQEPIEANALWILKARHEQVSSMFQTIWNNYITFYTVFLTFSLGAMGWLIAHKEKDIIPRPVHWVIVLALILQSFLTSITSAFVALYSHKLAREQLSNEADILGGEPRPSSLLKSSIPGPLGIWAGVANCIAMLGMIAAWVYIGFYMS